MTNEYKDILLSAVTAAQASADAALAVLHTSIGEAEIRKATQEVNATRLELLQSKPPAQRIPKQRDRAGRFETARQIAVVSFCWRGLVAGVCYVPLGVM